MPQCNHDHKHAGYIWRATELARQGGYCLMCDGKISKDRTMAILGYGPMQGQWGRGHIECAWNCSLVEDKPDAKPIDNATIVAPVKTTPVDSRSQHSRSFVRNQGGPRGSNKYAVMLVAGKSEHYIASYSDERRAEGAADILDVLQTHPELLELL